MHQTWYTGLQYAVTLRVKFSTHLLTLFGI